MIRIDHNIRDKIFNELMHYKPYVSASIKTHLPAELVNQIDWKTFEIKQIDKRHLHLDATSGARLDVLCSAKIGKHQGFFYLHAEHEGTDDLLTPLCMSHYQTSFLLDYDEAHPKEKLPLLISILYCHSKPPRFPIYLNRLDTFEKPESGANSQKDKDKNIKEVTMGGVILQYIEINTPSVRLNWSDSFKQPELAKIYMTQPFLVDLSNQEDKGIKNGLSEIAATEFIFKYIRTDDFTPYLDQAMNMLQDTPSHIRQIVLKYVLFSAQLEEDTFIKNVHRYLPNDEKYIMNIARQREEIGVQKGILQEKEQIAKNMLAMGLNSQLVAQATKLKMPIINRLQKELEPLTDGQS